MNYKDYIPLKLEILSPVHIGSGQEIDPFSYIIRKNGEGDPILYFIDLPAWIESRENAAELTAYFASHGFADVRKYLYERIEDPERYALAAIPVKDYEVVETYERVVLDNRPENRMLLDPALKNPVTYGLIVPGSSLKGAIHTAILDYLDVKYDLKLRDKRERFSKLDWNIFGTPKESTFKALKISDFEAAPGEAYIVSAKEKDLNEKKQIKPKSNKNNCEITRSFLMDGQPYTLFGKMALGFQGQEGGRLVIKKFKESFDFEKLCEIVTAFYQERFTKEWGKFYTRQHFQTTKEALAPLKDMIDNDATWKNSILLRVGRYSHIESVTITNNRPFRRKGKKGLYPYGTTRTLANGIWPFGWVRLSKIEEAECREGLENLERKKRTVIQVKGEAQEELRKAKEAAEAERRKREEEQRRAEEEERRKQEEFEKLPESQKMVLKIQDPSTDVNIIMDYYRRIDEFEGDERSEIAAALKERWQKEGRWKVSKKKKQFEKVQKIKEILGES